MLVECDVWSSRVAAVEIWSWKLKFTYNVQHTNWLADHLSPCCGSVDLIRKGIIRVHNLLFSLFRCACGESEMTKHGNLCVRRTMPEGIQKYHRSMTMRIDDLCCTSHEFRNSSLCFVREKRRRYLSSRFVAYIHSRCLHFSFLLDDTSLIEWHFLYRRHILPCINIY